MKDKETKRFTLEKAKIEALIEKHRPRTPKTPDEVSTSGTGKNAKADGQEGTEKDKPPYKKATKDIQIKKSCKKGIEAKNAEKGNPDTLLGDPVANTTRGIAKAKEKGQKDNIGINDIGVFEIIFHGLPEPPELEGIDEDRLRELQNDIEEQLCQRDEERERNITKRVQDFKKTFDFVNSHLLKGVVTMAELTKVHNRQPMGKIKPTDKMVMMPSLFDGTKPIPSFQDDLIKRKQNFDVIMDDTFIHLTAEEHMDDLMDLFKVLRKYGLKLSPHKCQFFKKKIVYMGLEFQIQEDKVCYTPLKDKCDAIRNLESPKTLRQTRLLTSADYLYQYMIYKRKLKSSNGQKKLKKLLMKLKSY